MVLVQQHGMRQAASEDEDAGSSSSSEPPDVSANGYGPHGAMPSGWTPVDGADKGTPCAQQHGALQAVAAPHPPTACSAAEGPFCVKLVSLQPSMVDTR